jgi:hypothetical protein
VTPDTYGIAALDEPPAAELVAPPVDEWLQRRALGFGASDIAALFVGYDLRDPMLLGDKARKNGKRRARGRWKLPRIVLEKAGVVQPLESGGDPRETGLERERMLVEQWTRLVERGKAGPDAKHVDPSTIRYVPDVFPKEMVPFVDRYEHRLCVSPDAFARDLLFGDLGWWDTKCSVHGYADKRGGCPLEHQLQANAQYAALNGTHGGIVEGVGWSARWKDHGGEPSGPIVTWAVERDEALIAEIRQVVRHAWADVEQVHAEAMEAA